MNINKALILAAEQINAISLTSRLDAEVLLQHVTSLTREQFIAYPEKALSDSEQILFNQLIQRRLAGEPIAYIVGHKAFWSFDLLVTPDTLIPRPETEEMIEWILQKFSKQTSLNVADLGSGTGAIAIALAIERPNWIIHATDIHPNALKITAQNVKNLHATNVSTFQGSWCEALPEKDYDLIVSNPPYIRSDDPHLQSLQFEPITALDGGADGLGDLSQILEQAKHYLKPGGTLAMEHGFDQQQTLIKLLEKFSYTNIKDHSDLAHQPRFITGEA